MYDKRNTYLVCTKGSALQCCLFFSVDKTGIISFIGYIRAVDNEGDDDDYSEENKEEEATPGRAARHHISKQSEPDYTCYTIRDGINQVLAILIEAKLTQHTRVECAVAQVRY